MSVLKPEELEAMNLQSRNLTEVAKNIMHQAGGPFKKRCTVKEALTVQATEAYYKQSVSEQIQACLRELIKTPLWISTPAVARTKPEHYTFVRYFKQEEQAL